MKLNNNDAFEGLDDDAKKNVEEKVAEEQFKAAVRKDLEENPKYKGFFAPYARHSVESFINAYVHHKLMYTKHAKWFSKKAEEEALEYRPQAEEALWDIQRKKLFDLQCQWRAGLIQLDGIDCTWDFDVWERNIASCPHIAPVNDDDVALYMQYLSNPLAASCSVPATEDFGTLHATVEDGEGPGWFLFHNNHTTAGQYLLLPDKKYEMECYYRHLYYLAQTENKPSSDASSDGLDYIPQKKKPWIANTFIEDFEPFVKRFESSADYQKYINYKNGSTQAVRDEDIDDAWLDEQVHDLMFDLQDIKEKIPIRANDDWRVALIEAVALFKNKKIAKALPAVYEDYRFKLEMGIGYETDFSSSLQELYDRAREQVLDGRELNGEPRDFNF